MIACFRFFSVWPLGLLHAMGAVLGWLAFGLSGTYRRRFLANCKQAGLGLGSALGAVASAGCMVTELPRLWLGRPVRVQWRGEAHVQAAIETRKGVLYFTPHLGCFEVTASALADRFGAVCPITVLYRPPRKPWLVPLVASARNRPGMRAVPTDMSGVKAMLKALRRGEAVGLLPDQVPPEGMGVWAPFFCQAAYTMTLAQRLAQQTGASLIMIWGERLAWGQGFRVHCAPFALPEGDAVQAATAINAGVEAMVRLSPAQYLWGYARYKKPPAA